MPCFIPTRTPIFKRGQPMFNPSQRGRLYRQAGYDRFGQAGYAEPLDVSFSPVNMTITNARTSVRADSSASRGHSDETVSQAKVLVEKTAEIGIGDKFEYDGETFKIAGVHKRRTVYGRLDHLECDLELMP